jgi:hypothetical protein
MPYFRAVRISPTKLTGHLTLFVEASEHSHAKLLKSNTVKVKEGFALLCYDNLEDFITVQISPSFHLFDCYLEATWGGKRWVINAKHSTAGSCKRHYVKIKKSKGLKSSFWAGGTQCAQE